MRAILYDCSDHLDPRYRGVTLRLMDDDGRTVMQGQVLTNDGRDLAQRIAAGLGAELTYVGPANSTPVPPPVIVAKAVVVHAPAKSTNDGWLF
jgi:hypothetical protein